MLRGRKNRHFLKLNKLAICTAYNGFVCLGPTKTCRSTKTASGAIELLLKAAGAQGPLVAQLSYCKELQERKITRTRITKTASGAIELLLEAAGTQGAQGT